MEPAKGYKTEGRKEKENQKERGERGQYKKKDRKEAGKEG